MELIFPYVKAFAVGGALCVIGQLLIDYTKLTPARILTGYVVAGGILGAVVIVDDRREVGQACKTGYRLHLLAMLVWLCKGRFSSGSSYRKLSPVQSEGLMRLW